MTSAPLVVLADAASVAAAAVQLRRSGHAAQTGFVLDGDFDVSERRVICSGEIDGSDTARDAVLAAARGAGLLIAFATDVDHDLRHVVLGDLARLGSVRDQVVTPTATGPALTQEQRQLLELLASGATIPEAAAELYVSVRTAERRMGEVRKAFGVRTTAAAVATFTAGDPMAGSGDMGAANRPYRRGEEVLDP